MKNAWIFLLMLTLAACDQKIDGSSAEAAQKSLEKIGEKLSDTERTQLDNALQVIGEGVQTDFIKTNRDNHSAQEANVNQLVANKINGKTEKEVVALAEVYLQQLISAKIDALTKEIVALNAAQTVESQQNNQPVLTQLNKELTKWKSQPAILSKFNINELESLSPRISLEIESDKFKFEGQN